MLILYSHRDREFVITVVDNGVGVYYLGCCDPDGAWPFHELSFADESDED